MSEPDKMEQSAIDSIVAYGGTIVDKEIRMSNELVDVIVMTNLLCLINYYNYRWLKDET